MEKMNNKLPYGSKLFSIVIDTLNLILKEEGENIRSVVQMITKSISADGIVHIFGCGHSHLFDEDLGYRAGGLVPINPILETGYTLIGGPASRSTRLERLEGYASALLDGYEFHPAEVFIVMSQSGRNSGPVEAALYAKKKELQVVGITSVSQSKVQTSRHSSGKKLYEIADIVIDTHVPSGDAAVEIAEGQPKVAPISTIIGSSILQGIVAEVAGAIHERGEVPPVWMSSNVDDGDDHNAKMAKKYQSRIHPF
jgi:uncharacterized phosphosugar-binding protein